jgi:hypothetical protein
VVVAELLVKVVTVEQPLKDMVEAVEEPKRMAAMLLVQTPVVKVVTEAMDYRL